MTRNVISLTAIPPRFPVLGEVLVSLLNQTTAIAAVELYLPRAYRRFPFDPVHLPAVPEGVIIRLCEHDFGPATKVLPAVRHYAGQDVNIIFCDDDKVYDPGWAGRLIAAAADHPGCCIVEEGSQFRDYAGPDWQSPRQPRAQRIRKNLAYRLRRAATLGAWKPRKAVTSGYVDFLEGWGGVLVRPEFLDDPAVFDIPGNLWMVDDVWLSGHLERQGIPIWLTCDPAFRTRGNSDEVSRAALRNQVVEGAGRAALNRACIDHFRANYGIWGGNAISGEVEGVQPP
ncbi:MAG: glycosyltransferase family A protein [Gemmobacter sp.]